MFMYLKEYEKMLMHFDKYVYVILQSVHTFLIKVMYLE